MARIRITQVKSIIDRPERQQKNLVALGKNNSKAKRSPSQVFRSDSNESSYSHFAPRKKSFVKIN